MPSRSIRWRTSSSAANALCPSLRCTTPGMMSSAASARTPPTPSSSSCRMRTPWSPPYRRDDSSRSSGRLPSTSVSSSSSMLRPTASFQTRAAIGPPRVSMVTRTGSPPAVFARSVGSTVLSTSRYSSCWRPSRSSRCRKYPSSYRSPTPTSGQPQIGGRLDVIAREDAEAARVDRQRLVQAELGGEVRDGPRPEHARMAHAPRLRGREVLLHAPVRVVDPAVQAQLRDPRFQPLGREPLQQGDRVVRERAPLPRIEIAEQAGRLRVPAPPQVRRERRQAAMRGRQELAERARFADDGRHLRAGGRQQPHDVLAVGARLHRLQHQHALQQAPIDDRHSDEGVIRILAGFTEVFETRMGRGVFHHLGRQCLADQAREALRQLHADAADAFGPQADRRGQHQRRPVRLEQVHRTHVAREALLDEADDVAECLGRVAAVRDKPADFLERQ